MVKNILFFLFPLFLMSCENKVVEQFDNIVVYKNYLTPLNIPFEISKYFMSIKLDTFDARFVKKKNRIKNIDGLARQFLLTEYIKSFNEFNKNLLGEDYFEFLKVDTSNNKSFGVYACGKKRHKNGIISYIVLIQNKNTIDKIPYNEIVMYNVKDNNLCSVVEVSSGSENDNSCVNIDGSCYMETIITSKDVYVPIVFLLPFNDNSATYSNSWMNFIERIGIRKKNLCKISYSLFYIDSIGFVRFSKFSKEDEKYKPSLLS